MFEAVLGDLTGDASRRRRQRPGAVRSRDSSSSPATRRSASPTWSTWSPTPTSRRSRSHPDHGRAASARALRGGRGASGLALKGHGALTAHDVRRPAVERTVYARHGFVEVPAGRAADRGPAGDLARRRTARPVRHGRRAGCAARSAPTARPRSSPRSCPTLDAAPRDVGTLRAVVRRPAVGEREVLEVGHLDVAEGLVGDTWRRARQPAHARRLGRTPTCSST